MWGAYRNATSSASSALVKRAARSSSMPMQRSSWISAYHADVSESRRGFSSGDDDNKPPSDGGAGGGGRGDRGQGKPRKPFLDTRGLAGVQGGKAPPKDPSIQQGGPNRPRGAPRRPNFNERFVDPSERHEMKKGQAVRPKLAGRPPKGHGIRAAIPAEKDLEKEMARESAEEDLFLDEIVPISFEAPPENGGGAVISPRELAKKQKEMDEQNALLNAPEYEPYYWAEADYTEILTPQERLVRKLAKTDAATTDKDGNTVVNVSEELYEHFQQLEEMKKQEKEAAIASAVRPSIDGDEDLAPNLPYPNIFDYVANETPHRTYTPDYYRMTPLKQSSNSGTSIDLVNDLMNHPTHFASVTLENPHPENNRQPLPVYRKFLAQPPEDFLDEYTRFIFVTGLAPVMVNGNLGDFDNEVHRHEVQKTVSRIFGIDSTAIFPVDLASAIIGFATPPDQRSALIKGPSETIMKSPVVASKYEPKESDSKFVSEAADRIIHLQGIPTGSRPSQLAALLFPKDSDLADIYGSLSSQDIIIPTPNSALVRLESAEMADSAASSTLLKDRLVELGNHQVKYARARRNLRGTNEFVVYQVPRYELGKRLIVDGDMPTRNFFLSHSSVIHLSGLDPKVTKENIAEFFQPFCHAPRDVFGSTEFITFEKGIQSGNAYVGFDELGECEMFFEKFNNGRIHAGLLGDERVIVKKVRDKVKIKMERRPTRPMDELLDDLKNWEKYVDPKDIQLILDSGISKETLDDTFRVFRYHNPTFAALDQANKNESMQPELERGEAFKKLVQEYVSTLISCISTPEDPGEIFESLFAPGEEVDFSLLDGDKKRIKKLQTRREEIE